MPKHHDVPGVEASIVVNGQPCEEHDDRGPVARNNIERYIIAESGATFEVHFRFSHPSPNDLPVSVVITIDGNDLDEPLIRQAEIYDQEGHVSEGPISNTRKEFRRQKYRFAELDITAGEDVPAASVKAQKKRLADTGTISLHMYQIQTTRLNKSFEITERKVQDPGTVHEKALKGGALSHTMSLENAEATDEIEYFDAEYAKNGEAFAVFHFYYRSLKALKDLHVVKHTPEPKGLIDCDDDVLQSSSPEALRRMVAHWRREEDIRQRLKRERSESVTVVGDDEVLVSNADNDVEVLGAIDLRKQRRNRRKLTQEDEIIMID
ncbi:uncharacterized protein N0V89_002477 [Didymosphaeria variabile]|uniref:DUF7918 domain-containing protein n=1 Tax=Didymosphaeria variabile TaxID=1932322 RepID=A0A9W8XUF0_9PLEO|nr:uncharacterized protein N0V89_002477 [Didymosphaeria variabile]KAJ4357900.1 hypothetical protein N0V89_002477 [Didymosphaeria variabile]